MTDETSRTGDETGAAGEPVATARAEYHCPACGAEAHWNPGRQALVCPYCGTESPATLETRGADTVIVEHDLVAALRALPDEARDWRQAHLSVRCQSCQAISIFAADQVGRRCDFCGSSALVPYEAVKDAFRPESLLPLRISESEARDRIRAWYRRQWFAPGGFGEAALTDTLRGVYLPYWTFDADTHARWTADSGTYSYVRRGGKRVRQVRWQPAAGALSHRFDDDLVAASLGVPADRLRRIEPFPTDTLVPYDPGYLAGWTVERYQIDLVAAARRARQQMDAALRALCGEQVPGDTYRNLVVQADYAHQTFKHILAPVWVLSYTHGSRSYQAVVNGVTGVISGSRPWSWIKIALLVFVVLVAIVLLSLANR